MRAALERDFVTILVDKDRRPDIDPRYTRGGWPTLAWLDEHGEVLGADNFLEEPELLGRLGQIAEAYAAGPERARAVFGEEEAVPAPPPRPSKAALGVPAAPLAGGPGRLCADAFGAQG